MNESKVYNSSDISLYNIEFYQKISKCKQIVFKFYWKPLGDSLLALSLIIAILDYLEFTKNTKIKVGLDLEKDFLVDHILRNKNIEFINNAIELYKFEEDTVLISDMDPLVSLCGNYHYCTEDGRIFPPLRVGKNKYFNRPSRYYARILLELGQIPDRIDSFLPSINVDADIGILEKFNIPQNFSLLINYSGEIEKKYGLSNYYRLGENIKNTFGITPIIITNMNEEDPVIYRKLIKKGANIISIKSLTDLMKLSVFAEFIVSNDTGASHLLAMIEGNTDRKVYCLSSRHDNEKWSTGNVSQIAIENTLSKYLSKYHYSLKRDKNKIPKRIVNQEWTSDIRVNKIINTIRKNYESNNPDQK